MKLRDVIRLTGNETGIDVLCLFCKKPIKRYVRLEMERASSDPRGESMRYDVVMCAPCLGDFLYTATVVQKQVAQM